MSAIGGAIAGAFLGGHFGALGRGGVRSGLYKGALAGMFAGGVLNTLRPRVSEDRGVAGNALAGLGTGLALGASGAMVGSSLLPGGPGQKLLSMLATRTIPWAAGRWPTVDRWLGRRASAMGLATNQPRDTLLNIWNIRRQRARGLGGSHMGYYAGFGPTGPGTPKAVEYLFGVPNVANLVHSTGMSLGSLPAGQVASAAMRDMAGTAAVGAGLGLAAGAVYGMANRPSQRYHMDYPGVGMYARKGIGSNQALNPM